MVNCECGKKAQYINGIAWRCINKECKVKTFYVGNFSNITLKEKTLPEIK